MSASDLQLVAEATRDRMFAADAAAKMLGMRVTAIGPGSATVTMPVRPELLNGFGICQGGLITTLADTAFAYACNASGAVTVAHAVQVSQAGRTGIYDVGVTNQDGLRIALFRGRSHRLNRQPVGGPRSAPGG